MHSAFNDMNEDRLALSEKGYEVFIFTDASGGVSVEAHERAVQRMVQAGAAPLTTHCMPFSTRLLAISGITRTLKQQA